MTTIRHIKAINRVMLALLFISTQAVAAPDYAREQRWADEVEPGIVVGDALYLTQKNGHRFLGILTPAENARMGVVVVHGMGIHPNWGLIGTLRQRLPEHAYTTLSIQMPVLAADIGYEAYPALFPDAAERIGLAVAYLKNHGYQRIAIVSHSNGTRMSRVYMVSQPSEVNAWVSLSMTQGDSYQGITVPVLDLYAEHDLPHVVSPSARRKLSLAGNIGSKQQVIPATDHFFTGQEEAMVEAVKTFLDAVK